MCGKTILVWLSSRVDWTHVLLITIVMIMIMIVMMINIIIISSISLHA
jgi:hypothetical protein